MAFLAGITDELAPSGRSLTLLSAAPEGDLIPARDVAIDGAIVYSCNPESSAVSWLMRRRLPWSSSTRPRPRASPASTSTTGWAPGRRPSTSSTWAIAGSAIVTTGYAGEFGVLTDPLEATIAYTERQRLLGWYDALEAGRHRAHRRAAAPRRTPDDIGAAAAPDARSGSDAAADRHPVLLRRHRPRGDPRHPGRRACRCRRTSRSSASTTTRSAGGSARR